jgi:ribonuclease H / adenosylcobalamin/alpha-ribazole phosphatase
VARRLVIEADGGARGNPGPAAYGALVRDADTGDVLVESAEHLGVATNNVAEYRGLLAGLMHARDLDPDAEVEARLDSRLVVEQMSGRWAIKNAALREIALAARNVFPSGRVRYTWVPREQNRDADRLVNEVLDAVDRGGEGALVRRPGEGPVESSDGVPLDDVVGFAEEELALAEGDESSARPVNRVVGWSPDLGPPTTTLLARHGATRLSLEKRFSGEGGEDVPLAPVGERQAEALAAELVERGPLDLVVASPLLRARQTATIVAHAAGVEVEVDDGFAECAFGDWDGRSFAEVLRRWPVELEAWLASTDVAPPGGESFAHCRRRVDAARTRLLERHPGRRIALVSHVSPIKLAVGLAIDAPLHSLFRMELAPCSITSIAWYADGNASLLGFAESAHLRGIDVPFGT